MKRGYHVITNRLTQHEQIWGTRKSLKAAIHQAAVQTRNHNRRVDVVAVGTSSQFPIATCEPRSHDTRGRILPDGKIIARCRVSRKVKQALKRASRRRRR